jgi:ABC-type polysaccharide/polyol phosphate transport system ATPase subunit
VSAVVTAERLAKRYRLGTERSGLGILRALASGARPTYHWAVRDVSFSLRAGEVLGVIGPNGSGKTTILKLLSRVTHPTRGAISVAGRLSALVELGAGFHPDLSGRDNVFLNAAILGMRRDEVEERFDQIVEFAGIGEYLDTPVKRYSSGMYARLGFATAVHVNPDVLLVDEVLAVGDYAFQLKCFARMEELRARGTSIVLVSHNFDLVRRMCTRVLVMYRGSAIFMGGAHEAVAAYSDAVRQAARRSTVAVPAEGGLSERVMTFDAELKAVALVDEHDEPVSVLASGGAAHLRIDVEFHRAVRGPVFGFSVFAEDGRRVYVTNTRWMGIATPDFAAGERCRVRFRWRVALLDGTYELGADLTAPDLTHFYDRMERALSFSVTAGSGAEGLVELGAVVSVDRIPTEGAAAS